jgi:hypothetical protein
VTSMSVPFGVGSVLATSVRIWVRNLPRLLAITAVLYVPMIAWLLAFKVDALRDPIAWYYIRIGAHPVLRELPDGLFVIHACLTAAIAHGTLVALGGRRVPIGRALMTAMRRSLPVLGVALVIWGPTSGMIAILSWLLGAPWFAALGDQAVLGFYGMPLWSFVLSSLFFVALPIAAMERRAVVGSIVRGFRLVHQGWFEVFALVFMWQILGWGIHQLADLIVFPLPTNAEDAYTMAQIGGFLEIGQDIVLSSLGAVIAAVTYRSLREDKDGLATDELVKIFA